jgi:hypothetical protein
MSQQQEEHEPPQKKSPTTKEMFQDAVANASRVMENTDTVTGTPRLIVEGGLLGTCIVFLATMLSLPKLDARLTIALIAFSIALPILGFSFTNAIYKPRPVRGHLVLQAMLVGAWIAGSIGDVCAVIGIFFVIWHLSNAAIIAFVAAIIFVLVAVPIFSFIGLMIYAMVQYQKEQRKQQTTPEPENKEN